MHDKRAKNECSIKVLKILETEVKTWKFNILID